MLKIFSDGGARGNPGKAASAFVAEQDGKIIKKESAFIGIATNNVAEYKGVILALKWLTGNPSFTSGVASVEFVLDSELVVKQLNGLYKVKNENLRNLFFTIRALEKETGVKINFVHVTRDKNKLADFLVNEKLDQT